MSAAPKFDGDLDELRAALTADVERLAEALLGPPNPAVSSKKQWRWGSRGSTSLELRGRKRGHWFDHEAGIGGSALDLVMHARGCRFAEAAAWARSWSGQSDAPRKAPPRPTQAQREAEQAAEHAKAIRTARAMAQASDPISGTVAETYLVATRAIDVPAGGWPDDAIRFHAPTRSLGVRHRTGRIARFLERIENALAPVGSSESPLRVG